MNWQSWSEFASMGGYGLYVWGSTLVVLAALALELGELAWHRRDVLKQLKAAQP
jgi:heme exporter protein D